MDPSYGSHRMLKRSSGGLVKVGVNESAIKSQPWLEILISKPAKNSRQSVKPPSFQSLILWSPSYLWNDLTFCPGLPVGKPASILGGGDLYPKKIHPPNKKTDHGTFKNWDLRRFLLDFQGPAVSCKGVYPTIDPQRVPPCPPPHFFWGGIFVQALLQVPT